MNKGHRHEQNEPANMLVRVIPVAYGTGYFDGNFWLIYTWTRKTTGKRTFNTPYYLLVKSKDICGGWSGAGLFEQLELRLHLLPLIQMGKCKRPEYDYNFMSNSRCRSTIRHRRHAW